MPVLLRAFSEITSQTQTVQLGDTSYLVRLIWRERTFAWYLTISTIDGVDILTGVRIEPQQPVMRFADPALFPDGTIITAQAGILGGAGTRSRVWLVPSVGGPGSATVAAGSAFRVPGEDHVWTLLTDATKPVGGSFHPALAEASITGEVEAAAATITEVVTALTTTGATITAVTNPTAAGEGVDAFIGTEATEVVQEDLATDLLLVFYLNDELPEADADEDAPTITIP